MADPDFAPPNGGVVPIDENRQFLISVDGSSNFTAVVNVTKGGRHSPAVEIALADQLPDIDVVLGGRATLNRNGDWLVRLSDGKRVRLLLDVPVSRHHVKPERYAP